MRDHGRVLGVEATRLARSRFQMRLMPNMIAVSKIEVINPTENLKKWYISKAFHNTEEQK